MYMRLYIINRLLCDINLWHLAPKSYQSHISRAKVFVHPPTQSSSKTIYIFWYRHFPLTGESRTLTETRSSNMRSAEDISKRYRSVQSCSWAFRQLVLLLLLLQPTLPDSCHPTATDVCDVRTGTSVVPLMSLTWLRKSRRSASRQLAIYCFPDPSRPSVPTFYLDVAFSYRPWGAFVQKGRSQGPLSQLASWR